MKKDGKVFNVHSVASSRRDVIALVHYYAALDQDFKQLSESKFLKTHDRTMS